MKKGSTLHSYLWLSKNNLSHHGSLPLKYTQNGQYMADYSRKLQKEDMTDSMCKHKEIGNSTFSYNTLVFLIKY
jgi:hypothetical protein